MPMISVASSESLKLKASLHDSWRLSSEKLTLRGDKFDPTSFGKRFKAAFKNAKNTEIARKLGVSESAVSNYAGGRVPDAETLVEIKKLTNCNLDWLLTGNGNQTDLPPELPNLLSVLDDRIREIVRSELRASAEVGPMTKADVMLARNLGRVGGDAEEEEEKRKAG